MAKLNTENKLNERIIYIVKTKKYENWNNGYIRGILEGMGLSYQWIEKKEYDMLDIVYHNDEFDRIMELCKLNNIEVFVRANP